MQRDHVETVLASHLDTTRGQLSQKIDNLTEVVKGDAIDDEINEARDLINARSFRDAEVILRRLQSKKQHSLSRHQRYRIVSNFGAIAFGEGRAEDAAQHFLEAVLLQPEDEQARVNEVFAYFLRHDLTKTFQLSSERRNAYPFSTRLASLWIMSAPASTMLEDLESALDSALLSDSEVCVALARHAMLHLEFDKARHYVEAATSSGPRWSQPLLVRAQISMHKLQAENIGLHTNQPQERPRLIESGIADASGSFELAKTEGPWTMAEALVVRSQLHLLRGDVSKATEDAKSAYKLDSDSPNAMVNLAQCHLVVGALDRAIEILEDAYAKEARVDVVTLYSRALADRAREGDLRRAVDICVQVEVATIHISVRLAYCTWVVQCIAKTGDWSAAQDFLDKATPCLDSATSQALAGFIQQGRGDVTTANACATAARESMTVATDVSTKEFIARLFMQLGRPADALPLYQELFDKQISSFDPGQFIDCAAKLHLDHKVMEICNELHERATPNWQLLEFEVQYLERYDSQKAIGRLQEFLKAYPDHKLARLRLSIIGYLQGRPELIRASMRDLPSVEEVPVEYLRPTLGIMRQGDDHDLVIDYAYRFLRSHFDEQRAHEAYIQAVLTATDRPYPPTLEVVAENSAVLCQETPGGELRWFVLEDTEQPARAFEEISLHDPIATELIGKRVGETFVLARASMANREAQVKQIMPKYVRRFQDCMNELQVRFGRSRMLQSVRFGPDEGTVQPGLVSIMKAVQDRAHLLTVLQSLYAEQPMPLHVYGSRFDGNAYVALQNIAQTEGMVLKCFDGNSADTEAALSTLRERPSVLVDLSAIATIRLLGLEWLFGTKLYRFVTTESTWQELQNTFRETEVGGQEKGSFSYEDGRYVLQEEDPEAAALRKREDQAFIDSFKANVERVPAAELAAVEPKTRELLVGVLGQYGAETVVLAGKPNMIMWCDDLAQSQLGATTFGARRASTQTVLLSLAEVGILPADEYSRAVAKLIGMGFTSVFFDARCVLESAKLAEYRRGRFPLKQMLDVFQKVTAPDLVRQFLGFYLLLQQEPVLPQQEALVVESFLDSLWRNPSTHGMVLALRSVSARLFGLNVIAQRKFELVFDSWFRSQRRPII